MNDGSQSLGNTSPLNITEEEKVDHSTLHSDGVMNKSASVNKVDVVVDLNEFKETGGLLYIGHKGAQPKTDPQKISEWFTSEFLTAHRIYAIKEDEPFLLKIFTRNHEVTNRGIRRKGGRKVLLMGQEVYGDILLGCGRCGYRSSDGSNVRRHLKNGVCLKEKNYTRQDLVGLSKVERKNFLRRITSAKARAKKKAIKVEENSCEDVNEPIECESENTLQSHSYGEGASTRTNSSEGIINLNVDCSLNFKLSVDINKASADQNNVEPMSCLSSSRKKNRRKIRYKALKLGPFVEKDVIPKLSYDIFTVVGNQERIAWKPTKCHKAHGGNEDCQIVFKGARMRRRCLDLPIPKILVYRKLDCKSHHCNFTLFHQNVREAFNKDLSAKSTVDIQMYSDTVMTREFYHYIISLLTVMKMKPCQIARHLTSVWETILNEKLDVSSIPDEYKKLITLSKQTIKSIWMSRDKMDGMPNYSKRFKGYKKKKKHIAPQLLTNTSTNPVYSSSNVAVGVTASQPSSSQDHHNSQQCLKRPHPNTSNAEVKQRIPPTPAHIPQHSHINHLGSTSVFHHKHNMMPHPNPPHPHMQPNHPPINHPTHWLTQSSQHPPHHHHHHHHHQYSTNVSPHYPMAPPPPPDYYSMPGHFMSQYAPVTMSTSP